MLKDQPYRLMKQHLLRVSPVVLLLLAITTLLAGLADSSLATVNVVKFPSGTPVSVCTPSDPNSNCGGGMSYWGLSGSTLSPTTNTYGISEDFDTVNNIASPLVSGCDSNTVIDLPMVYNTNDVGCNGTPVTTSATALTQTTITSMFGGGSYEFTGNPSYITLNGGNQIATHTTNDVSFWIYPTNIGGGGAGTIWNQCVDNGSGSCSQGDEWISKAATGGGLITVTIWHDNLGDQVNCYPNTARLTADVWNYVTVDELPGNTVDFSISTSPGTATIDTGSCSSTSYIETVGNWIGKGNQGNLPSDYIQDFVVSDNINRHTSSFTVPTFLTGQAAGKAYFTGTVNNNSAQGGVYYNNSTGMTDVYNNGNIGLSVDLLGNAWVPSISTSKIIKTSGVTGGELVAATPNVDYISSVTTHYSLSGGPTNIQLVNDVSAPGDWELYCTGSTGTRSWSSCPYILEHANNGIFPTTSTDVTFFPSGSGETNATPTTAQVSGTGGSGSNVGGGTLILSSGLGTGTATTEALELALSTPTTSGSTAQAILPYLYNSLSAKGSNGLYTVNYNFNGGASAAGAAYDYTNNLQTQLTSRYSYYSGIAVGNDNFILMRTAHGTPSSPTTLTTTNNVLGGIGASGYGTSGFGGSAVLGNAYIAFEDSQIPASSFGTAVLIEATMNGNSTSNEMMLLGGTSNTFETIVLGGQSLTPNNLGSLGVNLSVGESNVGWLANFGGGYTGGSVVPSGCPTDSYSLVNCWAFEGTVLAGNKTTSTLSGVNGGFDTDGVSEADTYMQTPILNLTNVNATSENCATSGTVTWNEVEQGAGFKKVIGYANACLGASSSYTYPVAFTNTPACVTTNEVNCSTLSTLSTTAVVMTGVTTTGYVFIEGN